jgi:hypothetical protein
MGPFDAREPGRSARKRFHADARPVAAARQKKRA